MKFIQLFVVATLLSFFITGSSFAATVDLTPVIDYGVQVLTGVLVAVASGAVAMIGRKFKIAGDIADEIHATEKLERAIQLGFNYARRKTGFEISKIEVKSKLVAMAIEYILPKIPNALKKLGISPESLAERIESRFSELDEGFHNPIGFGRE